jgi:glycosyltransferase involved in cell wall biosynthesis
MEKQNKFKIIIASYNNEEWVEYNIASILNQTYDNYEVIYVDDCSTDNTNQLVNSMVNQNNKFTIIKNEERVGKEAIYNYIRFFDSLEDEEIVVLACGDDWLIDDNVLENLNNFYNKKNPWMTYGEFYAYEGSKNVTKANPQNTPYSDFVHEYKLYRRDVWRASHLLTLKGFLAKSVNKNDIISKIDNKYYYHAPDLALVYPCLEMCPKEKIGVVDFPTYVWNCSEQCQLRTRERESYDNTKYEMEIRNKKHYKEGLSGEKLPQINAIGGSRENNSIPKKFSYVYNQYDGEFDISIISDTDIIRYINGEIIINRGKIVADIHEPPHLLQQQEVYDAVKKNAHLFDLILTFDSELLKLPNAVLRNGGGEVVLNKNIHTQQYPTLADDTLFSVYEKSKGVSFITSNKTFTDWHKFRVKCVDYLIKNNCKFDLYGVGYNEISGKILGLKDYKFSISIENGNHKNYFTEKILDCFLTGTIPIYKGCPNIGDFFDMNGIIIFDTEDELTHILKNVNDELYQSKLDSIKHNYELALKWRWDNDIYFEKYIKQIINGK